MADFTVFPAFINTSIPPNILLVLDHSGSMQCPAYLTYGWYNYTSKRARCGDYTSENDPEHKYDPTKNYYGYFDKDKYYDYNSNKFYENPSCTHTDRIGGSKCISGNLMNWVSMSRLDVMRKVIMGGKSVSTQDNTYTLRSEGGLWSYSDSTLGCAFTIEGGSYPALDHKITIADYGSGVGDCSNTAGDNFDDGFFDNSKWNAEDIGGPLPGSQEEKNGYLYVNAEGTSIWGYSDELRYIYQEFTDDFDVMLHVVSPPQTSSSAKAGLMIRETLSANSKHVMVMVTKNNGVQFARRSSTNGYTGTFAGYAYPSPRYPVWVRLKREGNTFYAYYSSDGNNWNYRGSTTVNMNSHVYVGMAAASYSYNNIGTAIFNEFKYCIPKGCLFDKLQDANLKVDVPEHERRGVVHTVADTDYDGVFDTGAPRFGLMVYNSDNVGCMLSGIEGANLSSFMNDLQSIPAYNGTPTGDAIEEAWDYYKQKSDHYGCNNNTYIGGQGSSIDPWYDKNPNPPPNRLPSACRKSFVIVVSDGEWSDGTIDPVKPARQSHTEDLRNDIDGSQTLNYYSVYAFSDSQEGRNAMMHLAMFGNFDDFDNNKYPYPYSSGTKYPSPDSKDVTVPPSACDPTAPNSKCKEWDSEPGPPDAIPDSYYEAVDGEQLEAELLKAIADITRKATSGTAVSVLATTGDGEGAIYQAYFFPTKTISNGDYKWLGYLQGVFVDKYGNMRANTHDTNKKQLDYGLTTEGTCIDSAQDYIVRFRFDPVNQLTMVHYFYDQGCDGEWDGYFEDMNGDGFVDKYDEYYTPAADLSSVPLDKFPHSLWEAGDILHATNPDNRKIYTTIDGHFKFQFNVSNASLLQPFMQQPDITSAENLINYIRGVDFTQYRTRTFKGGVWKLGDIVHSTPVTIGEPVENYDILYGDVTYKEFRNKYKNRRQVIYVGANDGMLHAFNGGFYNPNDLRFYKNYSNGNYSDSSGKPLGSELWAFIPKSALQHLQWYADPTYTHTFYVDGKPRVADVKIFNDNPVHPGGWGTILIGSMRFGGKKGTGVKVCSDDQTKVCTDVNGNVVNNVCLSDTNCTVELNSSYFALDITNPESPPILLWNFDDPDNLGLSTSIPTLLRKKETNEWYAVFGSGPGSSDSLDKAPYEGISKQNASIYILRLNGNNGDVGSWCTVGDQNCPKPNYWIRKVGEDPTNNVIDPNAFMADPITIDMDLDYDVDVMYIGNTYCPSGKTCPSLDPNNTPSPWAGKMYRLKTKPSIDPANWELTTLFDPEQPITAAPSASVDDFGNLWVYFGTGRYMTQTDKHFNNSDFMHFYGVKDVCSPWKNDGVDNCKNAYKQICPASTTGKSILVDPISEDDLIEVWDEAHEVDSDKVCSNDNTKSCTEDSECWQDQNVEEPGVTCVPASDDFETYLNEARSCNTAGWMYRFPEAGERSISKPVVFGGLVIWPTYLPSKNMCKTAGESFLYAVYFETGTATDHEVFIEDANSDKDHIDRRKRLGEGLPSDVSIAKRGSKRIVAFSQSSTGAIFQSELTLGAPLSSKFIGWKEEQIPFDILENED